MNFFKNYWDIIFAAAIVFFYAVIWFNVSPKTVCDSSIKQLIFNSIKESLSAIMTATSILLPAVIAITFYVLKGGLTLQADDKSLISQHFQIAILCYVISLVLCTLNLLHLPTQVHSNTNLAYEKWTAIFAVSQAFSFFLAVLRSLRGIWVAF